VKHVNARVRYVSARYLKVIAKIDLFFPSFAAEHATTFTGDVSKDTSRPVIVHPKCANL